jgi:hypothetical protein
MVPKGTVSRDYYLYAYPRISILHHSRKQSFYTVSRGVFTQNLKIKYFYKNHRKSYEMLWAL